jgi:hypothetical protein
MQHNDAIVPTVHDQCISLEGARVGFLCLFYQTENQTARDFRVVTMQRCMRGVAASDLPRADAVRVAMGRLRVTCGAFCYK